MLRGATRIRSGCGLLVTPSSSTLPLPAARASFSIRSFSAGFSSIRFNTNCSISNNSKVVSSTCEDTNRTHSVSVRGCFVARRRFGAIFGDCFYCCRRYSWLWAPSCTRQNHQLPGGRKRQESAGGGAAAILEKRPEETQRPRQQQQQQQLQVQLEQQHQPGQQQQQLQVQLEQQQQLQVQLEQQHKQGQQQQQLQVQLEQQQQQSHRVLPQPSSGHHHPLGKHSICVVIADVIATVIDNLLKSLGVATRLYQPPAMSQAKISAFFVKAKDDASRSNSSSSSSGSGGGNNDKSKNSSDRKQTSVRAATKIESSPEDATDEKPPHSAAADSPNASDDSDSSMKTPKGRTRKKRARLMSESSDEEQPDTAKESPKENRAPEVDDVKSKEAASQPSSARKSLKRRLSDESLHEAESLSKRLPTEAKDTPEQPKSKKRKSKTGKSPQPTSGKTKTPERKSPFSVQPKKEDKSDEDGEDSEDKKKATDKLVDGDTQRKQSAFGTATPGSAEKTKTSQYRPDKDKYDPVADAVWAKGEKIPYLAFCRTLECIDDHSSRLKMIEILSNFFRSCLALSPDDLIYAVYLCLNKTAPDYEGQELGIGDSLLIKVIAEVTGRTLDAVRKQVQAKGDLGVVAETSKTNQKMIFAPPKLLLRNVFAKLKQIAQMSGHSVQSKKVDMIKSMFVACRGSESKFLIRSLTGKLRIGLAESSLLTALAHAITLHNDPKLVRSLGTDTAKKTLEAATLTLKTVYCECPNYDKIIDVLLKDGFEALPEKCKIMPGVPMKPMLAHPTKGVAEVLKRFENMSFTCEFKYDGERAQIHMTDGGQISIFSRNQENNTTKYPDIIDRIKKNIKEGVTDFIMDSEAVAYDREKKQILPFQTLMHRKKKDVDQSEITIQVYVFAFDLLYLNGRSLVKEPFRERRRLMREHFNEVEAEFGFAKNADLESVDDIQEFLDESIKGNCEGLMVKTLDKEATYEIAKRSRNWLKLKKDYLEGVGDTLDVVVIGGWKGKGKRTGTYGGFLLACYDPDSEEFQSLCKIGTGFKEEELEQHTNFFKDHVLDKAKPYYNVDSSLQPDDWFDAVQVWEIKCADLSVSPLHKAAVGLVDPEKGISLRFPRFVRIREDKNPEDATSAEQIAAMYNNQDQIKNQGPAAGADDEDFY